jgi:hypothetical protein
MHAWGVEEYGEKFCQMLSNVILSSRPGASSDIFPTDLNCNSFITLITASQWIRDGRIWRYKFFTDILVQEMHLFRVKLSLTSDTSVGNPLSDVGYKGKGFAVVSGNRFFFFPHLKLGLKINVLG